MEPGRPTATITLADEERFTAATRSDALAACRMRIIEVEGEILSEIPTHEADD
jgi:hypothetical protein